MPVRLYRLPLVLLLGLFSANVGLCKPTASPSAVTSSTLALRQTFLDAEKALQQGRLSEFKRLKEKCRHYPLYPYLEQADLSRRIKQVSLAEYQHFVRHYGQSPLTESLQSQFLQTAAQQKKWQAFLAAYTPTNNTTLQCQYLEAQLNQGKHQDLILSKIGGLWLNEQSPPAACEPVFSQFERSRHRTHALVWKKIKLSIESNQFKTAKRLTRYLKSNEHPLVDLWIWVQKNPQIVSKQSYFQSKHPAVLEILVSGMVAMAKTDPEKAIQVWKTLSNKQPFKDRHWGTVVREIALSFNRKRHPSAAKWLDHVPETHLDETVREAKIRVALSKEDWPLVLHQLHRLPEKLKTSEQWQYWQARALEKVGKIKESQQLFSELAQVRSYYGLLSKQQLNSNISVYHKKRTLSQPVIQKIARNQAILRVQELNALGRKQKAKSEWLYLTQNISDEEKHGAAVLALRWNMPNFAILALSHAKDNHDLSLRFPIVHKNTIFSSAAKEGIDPALIFAVTRQESAFMANASSSAGALGLMQLMPSTAKMVAKQKKIKLDHNNTLFNPETNIRLGSSYLRMMLDTHKHPVLAIAAYNAGPGRIKQWLPRGPLPADNWIEIIPFYETREYVKNVLTYIVIYQQLLGHKPKLSHHMPMVLGAQ
jgi:soluble lytic murein transglycosylase